MGDFVDAIFNPGGAARDAAKAQQNATREAMAEYKRGVAEAKREIKPAAEKAKRERLQRTREAIDIAKYGFSPSIDVMGQGNLNAQNALIGGGNNAMNAILGGPIEQQQAQAINFDPQQFLGGMSDLYQIDPGMQAEYTTPVQNPNSNPVLGQFRGNQAATGSDYAAALAGSPFGGQVGTGVGIQPAFAKDYGGGVGGQGGRPISDISRLNLR